MLTVFTPTYNRAHTLPRTYQSLCSQTDFCFEWLVIDDGSVDETEKLLIKWSEEAPFPIRYVKRPHGGKHRAINYALKIAEGEAFTFLDSDDYFVPEAVADIRQWFEQIMESKELCGICARRGNDTENPIGGKAMFAGEYIDLPQYAQPLKRYNLFYDATPVYKTEILRKFPFPEFEGEDFMPESVQLVPMAMAGYLTRWYDKVLQICEYRSDGLTHQGILLLWKNPHGYLRFLEIEEKAGDLSHDQAERDRFLLYSYWHGRKKFPAIDRYEHKFLAVMDALQRFFMQHRWNHIAVYGLGEAFCIFRLFLAELPVTIAYGIDQHEKRIPELPAFTTSHIGTPPVDGCVICLKHPDASARDFCQAHFREVYDMQELMGEMWRFLWCD